MANNGHFIPREKRAATLYGTQMHRILSATNYDPAAAGLTDNDVTALGDSVTANQAALADVESLKNKLAAATKKLSGPKGTHQKMLVNIRNVANKARVSDAPDSHLMKLRLKRKTLRGSRRNAPKFAPEFNVGHAIRGTLNIRLSESGSASPRAKAANTTGVHIAVVDAAQPPKRGEADMAPIKTVSRSPWNLNTTGWPAKVRLYARWVTARSETSPWSGARSVTVM